MRSLLYIGSIVPDEPPYINRAFSRAGNMCQLSLLKGLIKAGMPPVKVFSLRPTVSSSRLQQLFYLPTSVTIGDKIQLDFLPFINISPIKQLSVGLATLWNILHWCHRCPSTQQNVIFTFNISVPPGIFALLGARLTGSKTVAMIYDISVPGETVPDTLFARLDYWLHKKTMPLFDGLVVITEAIARDFAPKIPYLRVEGGISADLIMQYQALTADKHDKEDFVIVFAGRLDEANGIREILEAFSMVKKKKFCLHIAGAGPLEDIVKESASTDSRVNFHGFISFDEILQLYATADVLVNMRLTQRVNTRYFFPSKTMEYLASGVPVITTCPGNMAEEYGDFAFLLYEETPEALAEMLVYVAAMPDEQRKKRALTAQRYMAEHKTWDVQAQKILRFIDGISNKHKE